MALFSGWVVLLLLAGIGAAGSDEAGLVSLKLDDVASLAHELYGAAEDGVLELNNEPQPTQHQSGFCWGGPACECGFGGNFFGTVDAPCTYIAVVPIVFLLIGVVAECSIMAGTVICIALLVVAAALQQWTALAFAEEGGVTVYMAGLSRASLIRSTGNATTIPLCAAPSGAFEQHAGDMDLSWLAVDGGMCSLASAVLGLVITAIVVAALALLAACLSQVLSTADADIWGARIATGGMVLSGLFAITGGLCWVHWNNSLDTMVEEGFPETYSKGAIPDPHVAVSAWLAMECGTTLLLLAAAYAWRTLTKVREVVSRRREQESREMEIVEMRANLF